MTNLKQIIEAEIKEFDKKFSPEWWKGFGTTDSIDKLGIMGIKSFLSSSLSRIAHKTLEAVEIGKILSNLRTAKVWELVPDVPRKIMISDKDLDNLMVSAIEQFQQKIKEFLGE